MKFLVKTALLSLLALSSSFGGTVDGVAVIVGNKAITMYEIVALSNEKNINKQEALEELIQKKLEESELVKQNINIDDLQLESKMEEVASANGMTLSAFKDVLRQQHIDIAEYKSELKKKLQTEKLYQKIAFQKVTPADEKDLKLYYENNKNEFSIPKKINAVEYSATRREQLEKLIEAPLKNNKGVKKSELEIQTKELAARLAYILSQTKEGQFTPIMPVGKEYVTFYIKEKKEPVLQEFEKVKSEIFEKIIKKREDDGVKEYFDKLKASSKIKVIRLPS